jgi:hypothetical protein
MNQLGLFDIKADIFFNERRKSMFFLSRVFLIAAVISFLIPCVCPAMAGAYKTSSALSAVNCQQNQASPCSNHACCHYTNHVVVPEIWKVPLNSPALVLSSSSDTLSGANLDGFLAFHPKIRVFYHPEYSQVLRL